jgi:ABC-2 type transport system permease protein
VSAVWAIFRRELSAYFVSPMAYAFMAMFLLLVGAGLTVGITRYAMTPAMVIERFGWSIRTQLVSGAWGLMTWGAFAALLSLPGLSMRLLAEEKKSGTAELLFTSPITTPQIVAGKYLASVALYALILLMTLPMPAFLLVKAQPELGALVGAYLGLFLYGAVILAAGLWASALTENQFVALVATYALVIPLILVEFLVPLARPPMDAALAAVSLGHALKVAALGTLDSSYVVVHLVLAGAFLFLCVRVIDPVARGRPRLASATFTLLVLAGLTLVLALSARFRTSWDLSAQRANSLSPQTDEALAGLDGPVAIRGLFRDSDRRRDGYWDLLQLYRRRSGRIQVEIFDPNARPGRLAALGLSSEDRNVIRDGVSVASSGDRKVVFRGVDEEDVTNAILEARAAGSRLVGFIRGYGERDPSSTADAGMSRARDALAAEHYDVADVRLDAPISDDLTVLVAAGLQATIPLPELDRLGAWLDSGGRLLVLAEPGYDPGLSVITSRWGLRSVPLKVLDRRSNLRGQPDIPLATRYTKHAIVRGFSAAFPLALPLPAAVEEFEPADRAVLHEVLVSTSVEAEGLTPAGTREQGPFALAAAAWKSIAGPTGGQEETRVVLVADAAFATNAFLAESSNRNFFLNCVGWLSRSRGLVSIRANPLKGQVLTLDRRDFAVMQAVFGAPIGLVLLVGLGVFLRRRGL